MSGSKVGCSIEAVVVVSVSSNICKAHPRDAPTNTQDENTDPTLEEPAPTPGVKRRTTPLENMRARARTWSFKAFGRRGAVQKAY